MIKKVAMLILTVLAACGTTALAAPLDIPDINQQTQSITISGDFGSANGNKKVTLQVMQREMKFDQLNHATPQTLSSYLFHTDQAYTDNNGRYSFRFKVSGSSGTYYFRVGGVTRGDIYTSSFKYYKLEEIQQIINQLENNRKVKNAAEIKNILSPALHREMLGIDYPLYGGLTFDTLEEKVFTMLAENDKAYSGAEGINEFKKAYKKAVVVNAFNSLQDTSKVKDLIEECNEMLNIVASNPFQLYASFNDTNAAAINTDFVNAGFNSVDDIASMFYEKVLLRGMYSLPNWSYLKGFVTDNNQYFNIDFEAYNGLRTPSEADKMLNGKLYTGIGAFRSAFNDAVAAQQEKENKQKTETKSSGGGSSGRSTVISQSPVSVPVPAPMADAGSQFNDTAEVSWAEPAINVLKEKGVIAGKGDNKFAPNDRVTRAEFIKILGAAFNLKDDNAVASFTDVSKNDWYYQYVAAAQNAGIVQGLSDGSFGVSNEITRQEMAVLLYRVAAYEKVQFTQPEEGKAFNDMGEIDDYARDSIAILQKEGIIHGSDGLFEPKAFSTRAQAAKMIYELLIRAKKI